MQILLKSMIALSVIAATVLAVSGLYLGMHFSAHPIKGDPALPFWNHLGLGLVWGMMFAAIPALVATILIFLSIRARRARS